MRTGFAMHAAARELPTPVVLETFPHAVAVALRGARPEGSLLKRPAEKRRWRRAALEAAGLPTARLRTIDEIDAALCAVTGWYHLEGRTETFGDGTDGVIVVPTGLP
jgi:predicted RNase H-like nuclease